MAKTLRQVEEQAKVKELFDARAHMRMLRAMLQSHAQYINCMYNGTTLLIYSCYMCDVEPVILLLQQPTIDVNIQDDHGQTALMVVCKLTRNRAMNMHDDVIVMLLLQRNDLDVNRTDSLMSGSFRPAIYYAMRIKDIEKNDPISLLMRRNLVQTFLRSGRRDIRLGGIDPAIMQPYLPDIECYLTMRSKL